MISRICVETTASRHSSCIGGHSRGSYWIRSLLLNWLTCVDGTGSSQKSKLTCGADGLLLHKSIGCLCHNPSNVRMKRGTGGRGTLADCRVDWIRLVYWIHNFLRHGCLLSILQRVTNYLCCLHCKSAMIASTCNRAICWENTVFYFTWGDNKRESLTSAMPTMRSPFLRCVSILAFTKTQFRMHFHGCRRENRFLLDICMTVLIARWNSMPCKFCFLLITY